MDLPGTTPLVAIALMEIAVSIVWKIQEETTMGEMRDYLVRNKQQMEDQIKRTFQIIPCQDRGCCCGKTTCLKEKLDLE